MPALIWWPHEISGDNNGEWGYHVRTSVETRLDTAPTHFLQNLGHDTWWATGSVGKRVAQNEYRKTKTKTKQQHPPVRPVSYTHLTLPTTPYV